MECEVSRVQCGVQGMHKSAQSRTGAKSAKGA